MKKKLLELYNATNGTSYEDVSALILNINYGKNQKLHFRTLKEEGQKELLKEYQL